LRFLARFNVAETMSNLKNSDWTGHTIAMVAVVEKG
jgi:hypothetical protein